MKTAMVRVAAATLASLWATGGIHAQDTTSSASAAPIVARPVPVATARSALPVNTELVLRLNDELSTKKAKVGKKFTLTVADDVIMGNYIVIPRGTPAYGVVSYRTGKGAFGKSAKMEIDLQSIDLGGRTIPISGHYRNEGRGNTGAAVGAAVAVGVFGAFVTGHSAVYEQGTEFKTYTTQPIPVTFAETPMPTPTPAAAPTPAPAATAAVASATS